MYDIICDIWKNPGAAFSVMPVWVWNKMPEKTELERQIDSFHKKGVDGFVIKPGKEIGEKYLTEEYFELVKAALAAAKRRYMLVVISDGADYPYGEHAEYVHSEKRLSARRLYVLPTGGEITDDEDILFRVYAKIDNGLLTDVALDPRNGYTCYDIILGYAEGDDADLLDPVFAESLIGNTYEKYSENIGEYFGSTVIGFMNEDAACSYGGVTWSYEIAERFLEEGGDFMALASLLIEPKSKKTRREADFLLQKILRERLSEVYLKPLADWCSEHKIGLFGYPRDEKNGEALSAYHFPGQYISAGIVNKSLNTKEAVSVKYAADCARHKGIPRSFAMCLDNSNDAERKSFTPDDLMRSINYAISRGCNMLIPCNIYYSAEAAVAEDVTPDVGPANSWWKDYRSIAGYMKRMSWLGASGTNNPHAAVLCSSDYVPYTPVKPLIEQGYTFNYLTLDDFMEKAHIHDGEIHIDRYKYSLLLIDGRLRLNADIVLKIGKFITGGGIMYRGSDFIGAAVKNVKRSSYFEGDDSGNIRFNYYTKSGCPFFLFTNEGVSTVKGRLVTDIGCAAAEFDLFTGKTSPVLGEMTDGGFAYPVRIPPHSAVVIGMNPSELPSLGETREGQLEEIVALSKGRMTFDYKPEEGKTATLMLDSVRDIADITVNGENAGRLIFMPYELDITELLHEGENTVAVKVTKGAPTEPGKRMKAEFKGCTVRMIKK